MRVVAAGPASSTAPGANRRAAAGTADHCGVGGRIAVGTGSGGLRPLRPGCCRCAAVRSPRAQPSRRVPSRAGVGESCQCRSGPGSTQRRASDRRTEVACGLGVYVHSVLYVQFCQPMSASQWEDIGDVTWKRGTTVLAYRDLLYFGSRNVEGYPDTSLAYSAINCPGPALQPTVIEVTWTGSASGQAPKGFAAYISCCDG